MQKDEREEFELEQEEELENPEEKNGCCQKENQKKDSCCQSEDLEKEIEEGMKQEALKQGCCQNKASIPSIHEELAEYKDKYFRALAETENMKKRLHKEKQDLIQFALQNIFIEFLNPIDHLENALSHAENSSSEVKNWAIGFEMILNQFKEVLENHGVKSFQSKGKHFNPHDHEAVETLVTSEMPEGHVAEESLKGYKMNGKTIRPARVKVSKSE